MNYLLAMRLAFKFVSDSVFTVFRRRKGYGCRGVVWFTLELGKGVISVEDLAVIGIPAKGAESDGKHVF